MGGGGLINFGFRRCLEEGISKEHTMSDARHLAGTDQTDRPSYSPEDAAAIGEDDTYQNEQIIDPGEAESAAEGEDES
jgi:hypothetical protein